DQTPPEPVRDDGPPPTAVAMPVTELPSLVRSELALITGGDHDDIGGAYKEGRLAVITSAARHAAVLGSLPDAGARATADALDSPVVVLTTEEAKGLEFDSVIIVDPSGILTESPKGGQDLYVALTRATRRLTIVHDKRPPRGVVVAGAALAAAEGAAPGEAGLPRPPRLGACLRRDHLRFPGGDTDPPEKCAAVRAELDEGEDDATGDADWPSPCAAVRSASPWSPGRTSRPR